MTETGVSGAPSHWTAPKIQCAFCRHQIDAEAKLCPYCGANPRTGERFDPKPLLEKHFPRRGDMTRLESTLDFFRQRQAVVVTAVIAALFLGVVFMHRFITARLEAQASDVPAIPLTEVADLSNRTSQTEPEAIPEVDFQFAGSGQRISNLLVEPGAVAPPVPPDLTTPSPILARFTSPRARSERPPMNAQGAAPPPADAATATVATDTTYTGATVPSTFPTGATPTQVPPISTQPPPPAPAPSDTTGTPTDTSPQ